MCCILLPRVQPLDHHICHEKWNKTRPLNTVNCKGKSAERDSRRCFWNHDTQGNSGWSKTLGFPLQTMVKEMVATLDYNQNIQGTNRVIIFKCNFFSLCLLFYLSACFCHCIYVKLDAHIKEYEKKRKLMWCSTDLFLPLPWYLVLTFSKPSLTEIGFRNNEFMNS